MSSPPHIETSPWERVDEWSEVAFDAPFVTVKAHNAVYEDPEFRDSVAQVVSDRIGQSMRSLFTTGLSLDPAIPGSETPATVLNVAARYARREFQTSLSEDGLEDVTHTGSQDMRLRGRRTAKAFQYDAEYPLEITTDTASATPRLSVRVWAAIWATDDAFAMAGGIYPLEDLSATLARSGTDDVDVTVTAQPGGDRREVFDRIREATQ